MTGLIPVEVEADKSEVPGKDVQAPVGLTLPSYLVP